LDVRQSLVLGLIQGLTEFIPVSSTAHLILAPEVLGIAHPRAEIAHTYDTFIQIGTVIPVLLYFWRDWLKLLRALGRVVMKRRVTTDPDERMVQYLILGSIPAGVAGLAFEDQIEKFASPQEYAPAYLLIGLALIVVGLLMWWAEATSRKTRNIEHVRLPDAWLVGFAQALALFPGVSRSGSTITAGLLAGLTREAAARFSFLLMTPIMLAATGYKAIKVLRGTEPVSGGEWGGMLLAAAVAAITGYFAIAFLLKWLRTRSLWGFAVYRMLVGAFALGLYFLQQPGAGTPPAPGRGSAPAVRRERVPLPSRTSEPASRGEVPRRGTDGAAGSRPAST
jgi:undecaprenyl-diphosphatase